VAEEKVPLHPAAAKRILETPPTDTHRHKNTGDMVTLITIFQQVMKALQTAEVRFSELVMRK
jgi:hypothetical protein